MKGRAPQRDAFNGNRLLFVEGDFMVLLFVTRQMKVFRVEYQHRDNDYPGGSNKSIIHEMESPNYVNPVPDFISEKK